jgi:putative ABC transport system ATP-binding protein
MPAGGDDAAVVELRGVCKSYGVSKGQVVTAADEVSLSIVAGSWVAVTGASGSGKSTLLHLLGAMERADAGCIMAGGTEVTGLRGRGLAAYRRRVGFVFQRYNLLPALTALDNVIAPVLPFRTGFDKRARGRELLAAVGLAGREQSLPARMSGGEQQRVAIARALVNDPPLLLADEPTGNLDSANAAGILRLVGELRARRPVTVIIATHDPQVAGSAERIIRLRDGAVTDDTGLSAATETVCPAGQGG